MNMKERMLAGLPYRAWEDGLPAERMENKRRIYRFNNLAPDDQEEAKALLAEILGKCGEYIHVEQPFHCDYGKHIEVGENFFANYNLTTIIYYTNIIYCPNNMPHSGFIPQPWNGIFPAVRIKPANLFVLFTHEVVSKR